MRVGSLFAAAVILAGTARLIAQSADPSDKPITPAEEQRLETATFRKALERRGLIELLELHLRDFPPPGRTARRLMDRRLELAVFNDLSLPYEERLAAVAHADGILAQLIEEDLDHPRRFDWRFTLAHSLIYQQGESLFTNILYRGAAEADFEHLLSLTAQAVAVLRSLRDDLAAESARIENLSVPEFEKLERSGYIEQIDQLGPRTDYLLSWARFFDALPRETSDPTRTRRLHLVRDYIAGNPPLLEAPHEVSRIQIQALVLLGMTARRLNDHILARSCLDRAIRVADALADLEERSRIGWALTLARIERVRNDLGEGRFEEAARSLAKFRAACANLDVDNFGLNIVAALLEKTILLARADAAGRDNRLDEALRLRAGAWKPLELLALRNPQRRDEVYATLYRTIDPDRDVASLDPFEQCAVIAGLLFSATQSVEVSEPTLDRAVSVGEYFLSHPSPEAKSLVPEVLYNIAAANYRRGRVVAATKRFIELATDYPDFDNSPDAAAYAAQLAAELYAAEDTPEEQGRRELCLIALETVVTGFPDTEASRYWRFYYARMLDELERYDEAAKQFALVQRSHEHYLESTFESVRCLGRAIKKQAGAADDDPVELRRRVDEFLGMQSEFVARISADLARAQDPPLVHTLEAYRACAKLLAAEILLLPPIDKPAQALGRLPGFDEELFGEQSGLAGRFWRVRLVSHEKLGRIEEASRAIPELVTAAPGSAGRTLQSLYSALADEVRKLRDAGDDHAARPKAELALILARQIIEWAEHHDPNATPDQRRFRAAQLAEANLAAGLFKAAREHFELMDPKQEEASLPKEPLEVRILFGYAESLFQLGEWSSALVIFNRLATGIDPAGHMRWMSLLRDLQCRTELKHDPTDIIRVIEQQRFLFPALGGSLLASEFDKLQRHNQRRADTR